MRRIEEKIERIRQFRPIDDTFFEALAQEPGVCEEMLQVILDKPLLKVLSVVSQKTIGNLYGRGVRLDALCDLGKKKYASIEIQRANNDNHLKRVRYNDACITARESDPGTKFENVPTVYSVYISEFDIFKSGKVVYNIKNIIEETGTYVDDGFYRIFVNTEIKDKSDISHLMQCFLQREVNNPKFPNLTRAINDLKHSEGGHRKMDAIMEEYAKEYAKDADRETAEKLLKNGASLDIVKKSFRSLSAEEVQVIYDKVNGILA